ncbi:hypothetical protein MXD61_24470 [Frankia sp. AgPm24]|uniref:hypothetical protein n=1 Tax=Frankia sp. AgPm24 TaxID=631128 RepID=UPI00200BD50F|nr:hypothetical protein [Frankia sp. AgPm24]MCK9924982.1 hypothetical protein [Frankia sp. AgPm24]
MGIPLSLAFFTLGAVLTFAVRSDPSGLDLDSVGIILMLVSLVGLGITLYQNQWRRRIVEESVEAGTPSPVSVDDTILVDPSSPYEAPRRREPGLTAEEDDKLNARRHPELEPQEVVHVGSTEPETTRPRS